MKYQATQVKRGKRRKRKEWPEWGTEWEVTTEADTERSETKGSQEKQEGEMGADGDRRENNIKSRLSRYPINNMLLFTMG